MRLFCISLMRFDKKTIKKSGHARCLQKNKNHIYVKLKNLFLKKWFKGIRQVDSYVDIIFCCTSRTPHPVHGAEVDSFSKVEALIESAVISSGKSDHELACTLVGAVDLHIARKIYIYSMPHCELNFFYYD